MGQGDAGYGLARSLVADLAAGMALVQLTDGTARELDDKNGRFPGPSSVIRDRR